MTPVTSSALIRLLADPDPALRDLRVALPGLDSLMQRLDVTQADLARAGGLDQGTVHKLRTGKLDATLDRVERLCLGFDELGVGEDRESLIAWMLAETP